MKGQTGKGRLFYPRISGAKLSFTLIEALITAAILSVLGVSFFMSITKKDSFYERNMATINLQAFSRSVLNMIANDVRQTSSYDIANNNPTATHIKFRKVLGVNTLTGGYNYDANYTQYDYVSADKKITRSIVDAGGNIIDTLTFGVNAAGIAINTFSFATVDASGNTVTFGEDTQANKQSLLANKKLLAAMQVTERISNSSVDITLSLDREIKIRND
jgi:type II secretory pathway pseudopilin PulG